MPQKKIKIIFSLLFAIFLMFSMLGNEIVGANELLNEETIGTQEEVLETETESEIQVAEAEYAIEESIEDSVQEDIEQDNSVPGEISKQTDGETEETAGFPVDETETLVWNSTPITDQSESEGITVNVSAPDADSPANISVEANSFSVYMLVEETEEPSIMETTLRTVQNSVITKIEALLEDGSGPVGDVGQWQVFRLNAEFELPNDTIQSGDTTVITLPDKLKFNQTANFDITDDDGNVVAHAVINGSAKTITLTYTDYAETHSDISGSFYVYVQIDRDQVDEEEIISLEIDVSGTTVIGDPIHFTGIGTPNGNYLAKSGWQVSSDNNRELRYQLQVNTVGEAMQNVTITDKIANAGFTINPDSIVIWKGTWVVVHGDWNLQDQTNVTSNYTITWNDDGSFTVNLGNIEATDGFVIRYTAVADYDLVDGESIKNDAAIRGDNIRTHTASANATYYEAGGSASGYVYTINIHKVSEDGTSLSGAVFNVIRLANSTVVGAIITDSSGEGSVSGLLKDAYQIVEVSAPLGYALADPVYISPDDFGLDKAVLSTITNKLEKTSIDVTKIWNDADNQDGLRPSSVTVKLLADEVDTGVTLELNADNNWTGTFTDLDEYQNGQKISYSVEEVDITGYSSVTTGDAETGYTITNTHEPETIEINGSKTWDDNDDQDGARPGEITIRLLAGGTEIDRVTVTDAEDWSWSFENLPKYENEGTEVVYSITEDAVSGYTPQYNGYDVTNQHTPGKTSVTVSKAWNDADNQDGLRPSSVTVKLLADEVDTGVTLELNADNNWTGTFTDLDEYQNGQKISYSVEEVDITGYSSVTTGGAETGYIITNTHEPETINIAVTKVWDDQNNKSGSRPQNITISLLADGIDTGKTLILSEDNDWAGNFTCLDKYKNGKKIEYSISESAVSGYTTAIKGDTDNGFTITNTKTTIPPVSSDLPKTGDGSNVHYYLLAALISGSAIIMLLIILRRKKHEN